MPERDVPGTSASACAQPMTSVSRSVTSAMFLSRRPSRVSSIVVPDIPRDVDPEAIRRNSTYLDTVEEIWRGLKQYLD